jgi:7,8-dihydropterin-6-yl-methyl-4-(beta-D-ribofuranosyl)aminobenzene 5'-phosphate synthase
MLWGGIAVAAGVAAIAGLATRYSVGRNRVERSWLRDVEPKLTSIGEVDQLSILPLVERLVASEPLIGEPGVAYLLRAGATTLLFDSGLNVKGQARSTLLQNADVLNADLQHLDGVVISHLHADHVGGLRSQRRQTFALAGEPIEAKGLPAYVPTPMSHDRADVVLTTGPRVIAPGVAVLPPLPKMMFWLGPVAEQALMINVRGFGLVLVSGCGHPGIERMLAVAERVLDLPIKGVVGGLHLPVHPLGTPLMLQATLGNPNYPWRPINERDATSAMEEITRRGPRLVALSSHDSTPWTYDAFGRAFGDRYHTVRVGDELVISAAGSTLTPASTHR